MIKERLHIKPTDTTPEVILDPEGFINIQGRGMVLNETRVPEQILNWLDNYLLNPAETTDVIIEFEYLNSFSTTILASTLRKISQVVLLHKKLVVHWYYEEDDEDILERGEYISETLNMPIEFIMRNRIKDR